MAEDWEDDVVQAWEALSWEDTVQWFATKEEGGSKRTLGGRLYKINSLIGTVRNAEALGWNLYLNANPTRRGGRIKTSREDVTHWRYIVVDFDPGPSALAPPEFTDRSHRIFSGRGYQCWVSVADGLEQPICGNLPQFERIMAGYLRSLKIGTNGWIIDTSCADLARVVRCPGSINQKTGRRATFEHFYTGGNPLQLHALLSYEMHHEPIPELPPCPSRSIADAVPYMTATSRKFLLSGTNEPGRHKSCYAAARNLKELGFSKGLALHALLNGAKIASPQLDQIFVARVVNDVWGKLKQ